MARRAKGSYYWAPRVMGVLLTLLSAFLAVRNVLRAGPAGVELTLALITGLAPVLLLAVVLAAAWRWDVAGGVLYLLVTAVHLWMATGRGTAIRAMVVAAPFLTLSILFFLSRLTREPEPVQPESSPPDDAAKGP